MDPSKWFAIYREFHAKAWKGASESEKAEHERMTEELARSMCASQGVKVPDGESARDHYKVAQVYNLEVNNLYKTVTKEVWRKGFVATITGALKEGEQVAFSMAVKRGVEPVTGAAKVVQAIRTGGNSRITFTIESIGAEAKQRLELALLDAVLDRVK